MYPPACVNLKVTETGVNLARRGDTSVCTKHMWGSTPAAAELVVIFIGGCLHKIRIQEGSYAYLTCFCIVMHMPLRAAAT